MLLSASPVASGSEVVGAATIAPAGAYGQRERTAEQPAPSDRTRKHSTKTAIKELEISRPPKR